MYERGWLHMSLGFQRACLCKALGELGLGRHAVRSPRSPVCAPGRPERIADLAGFELLVARILEARPCLCAFWGPASTLRKSLPHAPHRHTRCPDAGF